ncbi:LysR family transcriptional regulator [Luteipulveratus mongoliensis]|uniref:LysR family transcriptional regulator n=1 Tax=Luteipulveratus mongoliensis TaxID=571913 RepID=A0A0K1JIY0_9MICO|nr:LysR family transcriptional regulator [Luteipulveratus mongoliensis]AKU16540.1 LysR family transcriptional regulator [Luteipulveratus mongoliensis]
MSTWPDLTALALLTAVADHGSLSAGARASGMAQPNASRSVARLERQLGLSLVVRSTQGSTLTPEGLLVVDWARQVLSAATALTEGAATLRSEGAGSTLTVAASQTVAEHLLPAWLSALRATHPEVSVTVHVHNTAEVADHVLTGRTTVGFVEGPSAPRGTHSTVVAQDELVLVVAPTHPWAGRREPVSPDELAATALVTREAGSGTRVALDEALAPRAVTPPALELPSNAAVRVSVAAGTAPAVLSRLAVSDALAAGTLREVPMTGLDLHRSLRAVWGGPRRLHGPAADLVAIART